MDIGILRNVIDSSDTTVGGGAASALAGSMAAGMIAMVCRLSMKKPVGHTEEEYQKMAEEADTLAVKLLDGANADKAAFLKIRAAFSLSKTTEEEIAMRRKAVSDAAKIAASVPRDNGYNCWEVNQLAQSLVAKSNPACSSDLMSALYLSAAGVKGCCLNIEANLGLIKDEEAIAAFKQNIAEMKVFF